jgi:hypothetical protein
VRRAFYWIVALPVLRRFWAASAPGKKPVTPLLATEASQDAAERRAMRIETPVRIAVMLITEKCT